MEKIKKPPAGRGWLVRDRKNRSAINRYGEPPAGLALGLNQMSWRLETAASTKRSRTLRREASRQCSVGSSDDSCGYDGFATCTGNAEVQPTKDWNVASTDDGLEAHLSARRGTACYAGIPPAWKTIGGRAAREPFLRSSVGKKACGSTNARPAPDPPRR